MCKLYTTESYVWSRTWGKAKLVLKQLPWSELQKCCSAQHWAACLYYGLSPHIDNILFFFLSDFRWQLFNMELSTECFSTPMCFYIFSWLFSMYLWVWNHCNLHCWVEKPPLRQNGRNRKSSGKSSTVILGMFLKLHCLVPCSFSFTSHVNLQCHLSLWCLQVFPFCVFSFFLHDML